MPVLSICSSSFSLKVILQSLLLKSIFKAGENTSKLHHINQTAFCPALPITFSTVLLRAIIVLLIQKVAKANSKLPWKNCKD